MGGEGMGGRREEREGMKGGTEEREKGREGKGRRKGDLLHGLRGDSRRWTQLTRKMLILTTVSY